MKSNQPKIEVGEVYYHKKLEIFVKVIKVDGVYARYEIDNHPSGIQADTHITNLVSIQESAEDDR